MTGFVQLIGTREACRSRADDGHRLSRAGRRRIWCDPAFLPTLVDNGALDAFDCDRRFDNTQHARTFAGRGTNAAGKLREIVRLVQTVKRLAPESAVDEVIPLRNQVVDRTTCGHAANKFARVTKRNAAIHAAGTLRAEFVLRQMEVKFVPVRRAIESRHVGRDFAKVFDESSRFSHN